MSVLKQTRSDASGVTYADPLDLDFTVRFKFTSGTKNLGGHSVENRITEIITNDNHSLDISEDTVTDALSIRTKVSGSTLSSARKIAMLKQHALDLAVWCDELVLDGFPPTTAPTSLVVA